MSHVVTMKVRVTDLDCLERAADRLGLELVRGQKTYRWFGKWVNDYHAEDAAYRDGVDPSQYGKCDHVLRVRGVSGAYEVGLVDDGEGGFRVIYDFYNGGFGLMGHIGDGEKDCNKLMREYSKQVAIDQLEEQGFVFDSEEVSEDGSVELLFES